MKVNGQGGDNGVFKEKAYLLQHSCRVKEPRVVEYLDDQLQNAGMSSCWTRLISRKWWATWKFQEKVMLVMVVDSAVYPIPYSPPARASNFGGELPPNITSASRVDATFNGNTVKDSSE
jgi:hypothetical protein